MAEKLWEEWRYRVFDMKGLFETIMKTRKTRGFQGIISPEDVERAKKNVETCEWAKRLFEKIRADADWWVNQSDENIYSLIPPENPRALCPNFEKGCPIHGGARQAFETDMEHPYQWRCREGGEWWYNGAVVRNPKTSEEVTVLDDGDGWTAPEGFLNPGTTYYFVAAYRYYLLGKLFLGPYSPETGEAGYQGGTPLVQLALAYALTGDRRYAHKCALMLNRLAELYRGYDGCVEDGVIYTGKKGRYHGYVDQTSFETAYIVNFALAYDLIFDAIREDEELIRFLSERGDADYNGDGRTDTSDLEYNVQHNLFTYAYEFIKRCTPILTGDFLIEEIKALSAMAACLGNGDLAYEALETPRGLKMHLANSFFRDGKWWYDSTGYGVGTARTVLEVLEWLHGFSDGARHTVPLNPYEDPDYRVRDLVRFIAEIECDGRLPQIGDTGGGREKVLSPSYSLADERVYLRLPEFRDQYAQRLYAASGGDLESFRVGRADWWLLFHGKPITLKKPKGPYTPESVIFHDSGIPILRSGRDPNTRKHLNLNYSKGNRGHGHGDKLAVNLIAYGHDLTADVGYPSTWGQPKFAGWETHTASHNTVMINERNQELCAGSLNLFKAFPTLKVVETSGEKAYPGIQCYRRLCALIDFSPKDAYILDIFRVSGGTIHDYLFHALGGERGENFQISLKEGEKAFTKQAKGTLAGEDVEFGTKPGVGFIFDIERAKTDGDFSATWRVGDPEGTALRLTLLGEKGREIIVGRGEGNGVMGKSPLSTHILVREKANGGSLSSIYVGVIEAYQAKPFIEEVKRCKVTSAAPQGGALDPVALTVKTKDRIDYIVSNPHRDTPCSVQTPKGHIEFTGEFLVISEDASGVMRVHMVNGKKLSYGDCRLEGKGAFTGTVKSVNLERKAILAQADKPLPTDGSLIGEVIIVKSPQFICNSSYTISGVRRLQDGLYEISLGDMPLLLSRGEVSQVNPKTNGIMTKTPLIKLDMVPGLFDGKRVRNSDKGDAKEHTIQKAAKGVISLADPDAYMDFETDGEFYVYDIGEGDILEIASSIRME